MERITVEAVLENLQTVIDFATEKLETRNCSMKIIMQTELIIEEIFVNICNYAYRPETGMATFCVEFEENPNAILMTFIDGGKPYNPLEQDAPDTTLAVEEREVGGLGIFLVRKNIDEISYEYADKKNILRMKKFF